MPKKNAGKPVFKRAQGRWSDGKRQPVIVSSGQVKGLPCADSKKNEAGNGDIDWVAYITSSDLSDRLNEHERHKLEDYLGVLRDSTTDAEFPIMSPPRQAEFLLHLLLPKPMRESLIGDLAEEFSTSIIPKFGRRRASLWYWTQVGFSICTVLADGPSRWLVRLRRLLRQG